MKLSDNTDCDLIVPEKWKYFDNCPVCRKLKKAAEDGSEISGKELEAAFAEAEKEAAD